MSLVNDFCCSVTISIPSYSHIQGLLLLPSRLSMPWQATPAVSSLGRLTGKSRFGVSICDPSILQRYVYWQLLQLLTFLLHLSNVHIFIHHGVCLVLLIIDSYRSYALTLWVGGSVILMTLLFDGIVRVYSTYMYIYRPAGKLLSRLCGTVVSLHVSYMVPIL